MLAARVFSFAFVLIVLVVLGSGRATLADKPQLIETRKIWDAAPHNAFTDLIRFKGQWYCVFREAKGHVSPAGKIRVIRSSDGRDWKSVALLSADGSDLRDPKISIKPDGGLMILAAAAAHERDADINRMPLVFFSNDGQDWSDAVEVGEANYWLWRITWHKQKALGMGYRTKGSRQVRLYESEDGRDYTVLVQNLFDEGYPNEASIIFRKDGTALCLLRRDGDPNTAQLGSAAAPFTQWQWKDLGVRVGGPHLIELADGRILAATRLYDGRTRTALSWLDPQAGTLQEFLALPSGGDTSYAGLALHEDLLWISYYSSHEGKTSIYLARVRIGAGSASQLR